MLLRLVVVGLALATAAAMGISGWALIRAQRDPTFEATVIDFSGSPTPDPSAAIDLSQATPTPVSIPPLSEAPAPWPPPELEARAIQLVVSDPQVAEWVEGHRYGAFSVVGSYVSKSGSCSHPFYLPCVEVEFYDYTVPIGVEVVVDLAASRVISRMQIPELQPPPTQEELAEMQAIIATDPAFGPAARVLGGLAEIKQIAGYSEPELRDRNQCGTMSPRHRCLAVQVMRSDGSTTWGSGGYGATKTG